MRRRSAPAPVRPCAPKRARRVAKAAAAPEPRFRAHFTQAVRSDEPRLSGNRPAQRLRNLYDEFEKFSGVGACARLLCSSEKDCHLVCANALAT